LERIRVRANCASTRGSRSPAIIAFSIGELWPGPLYERAAADDHAALL